MKYYRILIALAVALCMVGCEQGNDVKYIHLRNLSSGMPEIRTYFDWQDLHVGDTVHEATFGGPVYYRVEAIDTLGPGYQEKASKKPQEEIYYMPGDTIRS